MKGLLMMLKSMGVNVDVPAIEKMIVDVQTHAPAFVRELKGRIETMDARLERIENLLTEKSDRNAA